MKLINKNRSIINLNNGVNSENLSDIIFFISKADEKISSFRLLNPSKHPDIASLPILINLIKFII